MKPSNLNKSALAMAVGAGAGRAESKGGHKSPWEQSQHQGFETGSLLVIPHPLHHQPTIPHL